MNFFQVQNTTSIKKKKNNNWQFFIILFFAVISIINYYLVRRSISFLGSKYISILSIVLYYISIVRLRSK